MKLIWLALIILLAACGQERGNPFPASDMSAYEISGAHRFFDVTMEEALALRSDETFNGILYFGFPACPWCQAAVPLMHEASLETGTDIFYVSRRHELREGDWLDWDMEMAWWLSEQIEMRWLDDEDRPNIFVPQIIHLREGVVGDSHRGTFEGHEPVDGELPALTASEREELLGTYMRIFSGVHEEPCPLEVEVQICR